MRRSLWFIAVLTAGVAVATGLAWATTYHTITVNGNLADFSPDEKTAGDPAGDSSYGTNNDLTTLYVTWDAQSLYLGFEYAAEQTGVMYLVETGKSGGITNLCSSNAFPANVQGPAFDLMVAFYAPQDHATAPTVHVYTLASSGATDITSTSGVQVKLVESVTVNGRIGQVEAGIPWNAIYGLGAGKVQAGAQLQIAGVIRGKNDYDGLGDVSPDPTGGVKNNACGGQATVIDKLHVITVDANKDGVPETGWSPKANAKVDGGVVPDGAVGDAKPATDTPPPAGDTKPATDTPPPAGDTKPAADTKPPTGDTKPAADTKPPAGDTRPAADTKPPAGDTKPAADTKPPAGDTKPTADTKPVVDGKLTADGKLKADNKVSGDVLVVADRAVSDTRGAQDQLVSADKKGKVDTGVKPAKLDGGCSCGVVARDHGRGELFGLALLLVVLCGLRRRSRRRH